MSSPGDGPVTLRIWALTTGWEDRRVGSQDTQFLSCPLASPIPQASARGLLPDAAGTPSQLVPFLHLGLCLATAGHTLQLMEGGL